MVKFGWGFGKTILLGEHFVVHGYPALVASLELTTIASVQFNNYGDLVLIDHRPKTPDFKSTKELDYYTMLEKIVSFFGLTERNLTITLAGDLPVTCGGIGASAAAAASIARALNSTFCLQCDDNILNEAARYGESALHNTPSGIDNTAAVFGGTFVFYPASHEPHHEQNYKHDNSNGNDTCNDEYTPARRKFITSHQLEVVIADSGISTNTKNVIEYVKEQKLKNTNRFTDLCHDYTNVLNSALVALESQDWLTLGALMTRNHVLLQQLGVSCSKLDSMVEAALYVGALGAKVTGTGQGGVMVALTPGKELQNAVAQALETKGHFVIRTVI